MTRWSAGCPWRCLTGLLECVHQREESRRDGACEDDVLQERGAGEAPLHELPHVCLLIHVGAAQTRARLQERESVRPAAHWGRFHPVEQNVSTVPQVKCRVLGR